MNQRIGLRDVYSFFTVMFAYGPAPRFYALVTTAILGPPFVVMAAIERRRSA